MLDEDGLGRTKSRFGTLLNVVRGFVFSVLALITIMVVRSSMGVDTRPLLAGAGVVWHRHWFWCTGFGAGHYLGRILPN